MELKDFTMNLKQRRKDIYDFVNTRLQCHYQNKLNLEEMCQAQIENLPLEIIFEIVDNAIPFEEIKYFGNDLLSELKHNEEFLDEINNDYYYKNKDLRILSYMIFDMKEFLNTERNLLKRKELRKDLIYHKNALGFYMENGQINYIEQSDFESLIFNNLRCIIYSFIDYYSFNKLLDILNNCL